MRDRWWKPLFFISLAVACLLFNVRLHKYHLHNMWQMSDGGTFYVGAKLVGTPDLYSIEQNMAAHRTMASSPPNDGLIYCRLPHIAWLWQPLAALPFTDAMAAWRVLLVLALIASLWVYPADRRTAVLAIVCFPPAVHAVVFGQDLPLLLLAAAGAFRLLRGGHDVAAGLLFSLCASKWHLLYLTPIALLLHRRYRFLGGLTAGVAAQLALSFAVQGAAWPRDYWAVLTMPKMNKYPAMMPNLIGVMSWHPAANLLAAGAGLLVIAAVVVLCWRTKRFEFALAACLAAAVITNYHTYEHDHLLTLPFLVMLLEDQWLRWPALYLLSPLAHVFSARWVPLLGPVSLVLPLMLLFGAAALLSWRLPPLGRPRAVPAMAA